MHIYTGIPLKRRKNLSGNPGKLPGLGVTNCQNALSPNRSSHTNPVMQ